MSGDLEKPPEAESPHCQRLQQAAQHLSAATADLGDNPETDEFTAVWVALNKVKTALEEYETETAGSRADERSTADHEHSITPEVTIESDLLHVIDYALDDADATLGATIHLNQTISIWATQYTDDRTVTSGFELDPDDAEWLAALLLEFAEKARAGEEWYYSEE